MDLLGTYIGTIATTHTLGEYLMGSTNFTEVSFWILESGIWDLESRI